MQHSFRLTKKLVPLFFMLILGLQGCDRGTFLRSEKKILEFLDHTWELQLLRADQLAEKWTFKDGTIERKIFNSDGSVFQDLTAKYKLETGLSKDFLVFSEFTNDALFNTRWQIIDLDKKFLVLAIDDDKTVGLTLKEFVRVD